MVNHARHHLSQCVDMLKGKCAITETYIIHREHMRSAHLPILKIVLHLSQSPQKRAFDRCTSRHERRSALLDALFFFLTDAWVAIAD